MWVLATVSGSLAEEVIASQAQGDDRLHYLRIDHSLITSATSTNCQPGPSITAISTADVRVYFFLALSGVQSGDRVDVEWLRPDGQIYYRYPTQTVGADTSPCWNFSLTVAGQAAAGYLGTWAVRAYHNGSMLTQISIAMVQDLNRSPSIGSQPAGPPAGSVTLNIDAKSNIFDAGRSIATQGGVLPVFHRFAAGPGKALTFSSVTGRTSGYTMTQPDCGPDGCTSGGTDVNSSPQSISGLIHRGRQMFLTGVFLDDRTPSAPAPPRIDFSSTDSAATRTPLIGQTFFIGDGLTGTGTGATQQIQVPETATRLFLGFVDGWAFAGDPCCYADNSGSLSATFQVGAASSSTGSTGTGTTPGCNYLVQPLNIAGVPAAGDIYIIRITTALTCGWSAFNATSWIAFRSSASGTGNGVVEIQVAANTSATASRTGSFTVAGQTVSVTQNQAPACSFSLSPASAQATAGGGPGTFRVTATPSGCTWSATPNHAWLTVTSTTGDTVNYMVQTNNTTSPRSGTIGIAGLVFTVNQAAGGDVPRITQGGIVNAASYAPGSGGLARESFVSIFGVNLAGAQAQAGYPIPTSLGDVRVTFSQGSTSVDGYLVFVSPFQINLIVARATPLGQVNVTVTYRGMTSATETVLITEPSLGVFFQRQGNRDIGVVQNVYSQTLYPLNTPSRPAEPGMTVVAWATGLGASGRPENVAPGALDMRSRVPVHVKVDGVSADVHYAGTAPEFAGSNNIYFAIPREVRLGCSIPLEITAAGKPANAVVIAISSSRDTPCTP